MGTIQLANIKDYWSTSTTTSIGFLRYTQQTSFVKYRSAAYSMTCDIIPLIYFRSVFSRDCFLQIFRLLRVCNPSLPASAPKGSRIQPLLNILSPLFASNYSPGREVAVDEAMISFKGRVSFKQYVKGKPTPWGIKAYVLADSRTGYVHQLRLYFGKNTDIIRGHLLHTTRVVCTLTQPLAGKGHAVYCDRFYTSPELALELEKQGTLVTGTLTINRRGLPKAIKGCASLSRGSTRAFKSGRLLVLQWRDKRVITALSTQHGSNQVEINLSLHFNHSIHTKAHYLYSTTRYIQLTYTCFFLQVINRRRQTVKKPAIIAD